MLTIQEKRRLIKFGKLGLIAFAAIVLFTPKDFDPGRLMSFPLVSQAVASE